MATVEDTNGEGWIKILRLTVKCERLSGGIEMSRLILGRDGGWRWAAFEKRGFTLLELLVVMVIIGLLAAYVGPKYFAQIGKSERKTALAQLQAFDTALDQFRLDTGHYPSGSEGLQALIEAPPGESRWAGPYLKRSVPVDPWGNTYIYRYPGEHGDFDLLSYGKDGQPGGADESADITLQ